jgi:hypothetical protein
VRMDVFPGIRRGGFRNSIGFYNAHKESIS